MTARTALASWRLPTVLVAMAAVAATVVAFALPGRAPGAFPSLVPAAAPAGWPHLTLPDGTAVLSYPPSLRPVSGDTDAASAAQVSPRGTFELYLNATPRQGDEQLRGWAAFRLRLLTADDAAGFKESLSASYVTQTLTIETITLLALLTWTALAAATPRPPARPRGTPPSHSDRHSRAPS